MPYYPKKSLLVIGSLLSTYLHSLSGSSEILESFEKDIELLFDIYCYDCHGYGESKGGVTLDEFTPENIRDLDLWMRALKNTRAHIMPPIEEADGFVPNAKERQELLDWIKRTAFDIDPSNIDPGHLKVQRLNRTEYHNTILDLMGVDFDTVGTFPKDNSGEGFDNIGELLTLSPMLLEKYLDAATKIVDEAVPQKPRVLPEDKLVGSELVQLFSASTTEDDESEDHLQLTFYEPSIRTGTYLVEKAGKYQVAIELNPKSFSSFRGFDYNRCRFIIKIDGETKLDREFESITGKTFDFTFDYEWLPGEHEFSFEVIPLTSGFDKIRNLKMRIEQIAIRGPHAREHWIQPENYARFFPGTVPDDPAERSVYTREIIEDFTFKAFRRPADSYTIDHLVEIVDIASTQEGFTYEMAVGQAMVAILASPRFLYREEESLPSSSAGEHPLIDEYSLASRLSYFLWSTMPDEELFRLAKAGKLRENLDHQIDRMMKSKRSDAFIKNFAGQWLHARDIHSVTISNLDVWLRDNPNPEIAAANDAYRRVREIPENTRTPEQQETYARTRKIIRKLYDSDIPNLKWQQQQAMKTETEMYFEHIIRENRPITELLDSDYTFLNETLAEHYGIEGIEGKKMRKVTLEPGSPRGGVLTHGTLLAYTSNPTRTSPVKRGVFILENILGTPPAAPPPNIPSLEDVEADDIENLSLRDTLAIHREKKLCASCHNRMDPLGLALENFNAMGIWRDSELGQAIDSSGTLITGETFASIQEMKRILATDRKNDFYYCFTEKALTYALGRGLEYYDTETVDRLVRVLHENEGRPYALIEAIIHSIPFQKSRHPDYNES